jgi:hypothetical protein
MCANVTEASDLCGGCVYYPPNLPRLAYSAEDWALLQRLTCSFEYAPGSPDCVQVRKNSCSLLDLKKMQPSVTKPR